MVRDLAFAASNKAQNSVLKQATPNSVTNFVKQAEKRARELESSRVQVTNGSPPQILHDKCRPVLNAGSFVDVAPDLTPGNCSYGGHA
jgi:hypothetical protein